MSGYLSQMSGNEKNDYAMIGYYLRNTLSDFGHVSRGICRTDDRGKLTKIVETTRIQKDNDAIFYLDEQNHKNQLKNDGVVSMNLWGFDTSIFKHLQQQFDDFLIHTGHLLKSEFYIPTVVNNLIEAGQKNVRVIMTDEKWFGITYPQDKHKAVKSIKDLIDKGIYPDKLWSKQ